MDKKTLKALKEDVRDVLLQHSGLKVRLKKEFPSEIWGQYAIKDDHGILQGEFDIRVLISVGYPYAFPALIETSKKIERIAERHISPEGVICEEMDRMKPIIASKGISLQTYFKKYVHPYFCWQLIYEEEKNKNLKEWAHNDEGVRQFYFEFLKVKSIEMTGILLQSIVASKGLGRNDLCPCGSEKKLKRCHEAIFEDLKRIGKEQLRKDLQLFKV